MAASKVDHLQALIMRRQGHTLQEIGDVYGVSRERIRQIVGRVDIGSADCRECGERFEKKIATQSFCSRKCGSRYETRKRRLAEKDECPNCGGQKMMKSSLCKSCADASHCASERNAQIVEMWAAGQTTAEIARAVGATKGGLGVRINHMRREGYDLPYRRAVYPGGSPTFPEQVR